MLFSHGALLYAVSSDPHNTLPACQMGDDPVPAAIAPVAAFMVVMLSATQLLTSLLLCFLLHCSCAPTLLDLCPGLKAGTRMRSTSMATPGWHVMTCSHSTYYKPSDIKVLKEVLASSNMA